MFAMEARYWLVRYAALVWWLEICGHRSCPLEPAANSGNRLRSRIDEITETMRAKGGGARSLSLADSSTPASYFALDRLFSKTIWPSSFRLISIQPSLR
jgi:hypothetical protein